ncbi:serine/threonine-protein kinase [Streptomyces sp. NPDC044571]|uniref:serine/threonine-protein kinase n=1 Tax=Streptomyces sp. NPDC044571 TaxID=3155371 RepID=UPI0033C15EE6
MGTQEHQERILGGRYRLLQELGSGGFGRVWRAHDEALDVDVAVKEVRLPQPSGSQHEHHKHVVRAAREARNAAKLRDHPHIVAVHDVVIEDGSPWIVMRLVDGCSLGERLRADGPLAAPQVAEVAVALLKALKAAHEAGVVHRDLKPANVMLAADDHVLLTDFGIAVHETDTRGLTETGTVIGSVEYMAPERLKGVKEHGSGDLFSLGATLYEMVEGVSPFRRDTLTATAAAVAVYDPPPPKRADPALARLITALLAKEPEDRPTIDSALAMLRTATAGPTPRRRAPKSQPLVGTFAESLPRLPDQPAAEGRIWRLIATLLCTVTAVVLAAMDHYHGVEVGMIVDEPGLLLLYSLTTAACVSLAATLFLWRGQPTYGISPRLRVGLFILALLLLLGQRTSGLW